MGIVVKVRVTEGPSGLPKKNLPYGHLGGQVF